MSESVTAAKVANDSDLWNRLWRAEGEDSWRRHALGQVYARIERLVPANARVVDLGGGPGLLGVRLRDRKGCQVTVWDHSEYAVAQAAEAGLGARLVDVTTLEEWDTDAEVVVATEFVEHVDEAVRDRIMVTAAKAGKAFFSVPNDRLGPDEEPQHTVKFTAMSFLSYLRGYFADVRVEVLGPYLLAVCGFQKTYRLSFTMPVRDEAADIEATLASFRGIADEIVIGVDPRTTDATREIAAKYAEVVFELGELRGPPGEEVEAADGFHFAHARNQCINRCSGDWIFMSEGHERLVMGQDVLLALDRAFPPGTKVAYVLRSGYSHDGASLQQWAFPWLFANDTRIRFRRPTHNDLDFPQGLLCVRMPQVRTLHERAADRSAERAIQRKSQNRVSLLEDWVTRGSEQSLYYLATEWREFAPEKSIERLHQFLALPPKNGPARYQARLVLAKELARRENLPEARAVLLRAAEDDWSRVDHWVWLGDIAYLQDKPEEALQWYRYAATGINEPPFTMWWLDMALYTYIPAERLAMCYARLGRAEDALAWARKARSLLPDDAPTAVVDDHDDNIRQLEDAIHA